MSSTDASASAGASSSPAAPLPALNPSRSPQQPRPRPWAGQESCEAVWRGRSAWGQPSLGGDSAAAAPGPAARVRGRGRWRAVSRARGAARGREEAQVKAGDAAHLARALWKWLRVGTGVPSWPVGPIRDSETPVPGSCHRPTLRPTPTGNPSAAGVGGVPWEK